MTKGNIRKALDIANTIPDETIRRTLFRLIIEKDFPYDEEELSELLKEPNSVLGHIERRESLRELFDM